MDEPINKRQELEQLHSQLVNERQSFMAQYRDLADHILPHRPRFLVSDVNKGDRRNLNIIDNTATLAARTLAAGMMGGITSPARPWFRLGTPEPELSEFGPVKDWLHRVAQLLTYTFLRSNVYNALHTLYEDLGVFATSPLILEEDFRDVIRGTCLPVGSYTIATDERGKVSVLTREYQLTVRQLLRKFGQRDPRTGKLDLSNFSTHVKDLWRQKKLDVYVDVCHVIKANEEFHEAKATVNAKYKRFLSCYWEKGQRENEELFLRESGYDYFPVLCPRWKVRDGDAYGNSSPGMDAIGDTRALQLLHRRKAEAVEKMVRPSMKGPAELQRSPTTMLPGGLTLVPSHQVETYKPAYEVDPRVLELRQDIIEHQRRIDRAFYADLFLMLSYSDRRQITATEVAERHEEKLVALGPVLEQLNQDLLDGLIDITFSMLVRQRKIPVPPRELQGQPLKVEYISYMAQAQKALGLGSMERFLGVVGELGKVYQPAWDKVDIDQYIDAYADNLGVDPRIVRSDDRVAEIRQARAQAEQASAQIAAVREGAAVAKDLSQAQTSGDNVLSELVATAKAGSLAPGEGA